MILRPYQETAVERVFAEFERVRAPLVVMPTGTGKTIVFAAAAERFRPRGRVLVLAHREELIRQAVDKIHKTTGLKAEIEMGGERAAGSLFASDVVVATVQTLAHARRREAFPPDAFGLIVVDEAHHATATSYRSILEYFAVAKVLGVTATPDRGDGSGLGDVFDSVAFTYEIRDAIDEGYLVPIRQKAVAVAGLDLSRVRTTAGDLNEGDLEAVLNEEENLHGIAHPTVELSAGRPTMIFGATVEHAHRLAEVIGRHVGDVTQARALDGTSDKDHRRRTLAAFAAGEFRFLVNCALFVEGFDEPTIACVAVARPTKSRALYAQCLDASTEILTENGWRGIDDDLGRVAAFDPATSRVHWSDAEKVVRPLGDEAMWGIENPHLSLRVTAGHRMVFSKKVGRVKARTPWAFGRADSLPPGFLIPLAGYSDQPDAAITDADLSFLGLLLTDGNYNPANGAITLYQTDKYPDVVAHIEKTIAECGFKCGRTLQTAPTNYGERGHPLHRWTVSRGAPRGRDKHLSGWGRLAEWVSDGKSLTPAFELLSARQVGVLLAAMHMGNGNKSEPETWTRRTLSISVAHEALGSQVQALLVRRGYRCSLAPTGSKAVMLHIGRDAEWSLVQRAADGRPTWGQVLHDPGERVWCATVETGAIIVRRNGKVAVVGNCIGRGTRLHPGKPDLLVLDFEGNAGRHSLVSVADILGAREDDEVVARAKELAAAGGVPVHEAIDQARASIADEKRKKVIARARFEAIEIDPFSILGAKARNTWWSDDQPTEKQLAMLGNAGIEGVKTKGQASALIDKLFARRKSGLCSFKQAKLLAKYGLQPDVTFEEAKRQIDLIAANRWRVPPELRGAA